MSQNKFSTTSRYTNHCKLTTDTNVDVKHRLTDQTEINTTDECVFKTKNSTNYVTLFDTNKVQP
jgi:hypothetical protein